MSYSEPGLHSLIALIGQQRTSLMRLLDTPMTAGEIAKALHTVPGGVTHHLRGLEAAGLIIRARRGRYVMVQRTSRGSALLALYADAAPDERRSSMVRAITDVGRR